MIRVGIIGFGNLGKSIEKQLKNNKNFNLVAIFSKTKTEKTISINSILDYKNKIDILYLCVGSFCDLEKLEKNLIKHFNIIDCYDNHSKLKSHISQIDKTAKNNNKIAICSVGWDPGLFSLTRCLFSSLNYKPYSFWGKGTSQGHTQAIKSIEGVFDAIQFTLPNKRIIKNLKHGVTIPSQNYHKRQCFIVCKKEDRRRIKHTIINMPNYFEGYKTKVNFVSAQKLNKLKSFSHKGEVSTKNNIMNFSLNLPSNPDFTANVMISYSQAYLKLKKEKKFGAHTILDIPLSYITQDDKYNYL